MLGKDWHHQRSSNPPPPQETPTRSRGLVEGKCTALSPPGGRNRRRAMCCDESQSNSNREASKCLDLAKSQRGFNKNARPSLNNHIRESQIPRCVSQSGARDYWRSASAGVEANIRVKRPSKQALAASIEQGEGRRFVSCHGLAWLGTWTGRPGHKTRKGNQPITPFNASLNRMDVQSLQASVTVHGCHGQWLHLHLWDVWVVVSLCTVLNKFTLKPKGDTGSCGNLAVSVSVLPSGA